MDNEYHHIRHEASTDPISVKAVLETPKGVLFVRNPQGEWELPGGRPDPGEELEAALIREVRKECGLLITRLLYLGSHSCEIVPGKRALLVFFRCGFFGADPVLSPEDTDYSWIDVTAEKPCRLADPYWDACHKP